MSGAGRAEEAHAYRTVALPEYLRMLYDPKPDDAPAVARFRALMGAAERALSDHAAVGADDSEPNGLMWDLIAGAADGRPVVVPTDGAGWDLYSPYADGPGPGVTAGTVAAAAAALTAACRACVAFLTDELPGLAHADAKKCLGLAREAAF